MSEEIQWVLELAILDGEADKVQRFVDEIAEATKMNEAGALLYEYNLSEDQSRCVVIERYINNDAALLHLRNFENGFAETFFALFELKNLRVFGPANEELKAFLGGLGATFDIRIGGFARF